MPDLFKYSETFHPVLLEDMTATLFGYDLPSEGLNVRCIDVGALPEYYKDFGNLAAATWDTDNQDTNLEMSPMEMGQFRMRILDDMQCRLKNPAPVQQWRSKDAQFYLPQFPTNGPEFLAKFYWMASEFWVWEDNTPRFDFYSPVLLGTSNVLFSGWRYKLEKITTPGKIKIWLSNWPSGK